MLLVLIMLCFMVLISIDIIISDLRDVRAEAQSVCRIVFVVESVFVIVVFAGESDVGTMNIINTSTQY